ncbi:MAG: hypothetical protein Q4F41_05475 [Eubacteriales bacterium]|nr:hypothetical protein [Eubacteriales bacterium]
MKEKEELLHLLDMMSSDDFDLEAYAESESLKGILENQECMHQNPDEGSEETLKYWEDRGLKKILFHTESRPEKWALYLPMSYVNQTAPGKCYPLLFVMHGSGNPIYLAESYGYTHIAAREEMIVIIPETETVEKMEELFAYAKENLPVDWSRVYMVGYSLGGFMTSRHGIRWPERFAAVGIGGMLFANGPTGVHKQNDTLWPGETITPEMVAHAAQVKLPVCVCMGEQEILGLLPVTEDEPKFTPPGGDGGDGTDRIDLSGKNKIASVNNWRQIAGCPRIPEEEVRRAARFSADIVTEKLGFPFERTSVILREGRSHFVGDCVNPQGENLARFVCMGKSAHWPSRALAELTWEFIRRFSRDPETGELRG